MNILLKIIDKLMNTDLWVTLFPINSLTLDTSLYAWSFHSSSS